MTYVKISNFLVTLLLIDINDLCCLHSIMMISAKNRQAGGEGVTPVLFFREMVFPDNCPFVSVRISKLRFAVNNHTLLWAMVI